MQHEFDRVCALVVRQQYRRFACVKDKWLPAARVFLTATMEALDGRAVMAAVNPFIGGAELEFGKPGISLYGSDGIENASDTDTIHDDGFVLGGCNVRHLVSFLFMGWVGLPIAAVLHWQRGRTNRAGHLPW
jgi:hypothetical protein